MKTYTVTEKQIEELQNTFSMDGNGWWFNARLDEWVETLEEKKQFNFEFTIPDDFYTNRAKYFVNIELK